MCVHSNYYDTVLLHYYDCAVLSKTNAHPACYRYRKSTVAVHARYNNLQCDQADVVCVCFVFGEGIAVLAVQRALFLVSLAISWEVR